MIARSQIGTSGGSKYWKWYGFDSRVEWCVNESGDLNVSIPRFSRVEESNSGDEVKRKEYRYSSSIIYGYGVIK